MGHIRLRPRESGTRFAECLLAALGDAGIRADLLRLPLDRMPQLGDFGPEVLLLEAQDELDQAAAALRALRVRTRIACLVLGPASGAEAMAELLEAGADDVVHAGGPVPLAVARVRALLRRGHWGMAAAGCAMARRWQLHAARRQLVRPCGADAALTTAEYDLFRLLAASPGAIVCRDTVAAQVLRRRIDPTDRSVDNLVMRLRRKLGDANAIKTVRSQGYLFAGFGDGELQLA